MMLHRSERPHAASYMIRGALSVYSTVYSKYSNIQKEVHLLSTNLTAARMFEDRCQPPQNWKKEKKKGGE